MKKGQSPVEEMRKWGPNPGPWILKFLRLFVAYRALELKDSKWADLAYDLEIESEELAYELSEAASARIDAEDKMRLWKDRAEVASLERDKIREEYFQSIKKIANFESLRTGMPMVPFPEVYTPPPTPAGDMDGDSPSGPMTARQKVMEARAKSRQQALENRQKLREAMDFDPDTPEVKQ
ncbi:MAG TPA: hypothetical protein VNZ86_13655 [Bacteroidia bacterium]|nr:hypothetical protein [Bacteroidia bacterium]